MKAVKTAVGSSFWRIDLGTVTEESSGSSNFRKIFQFRYVVYAIFLVQHSKTFTTIQKERLTYHRISKTKKYKRGRVWSETIYLLELSIMIWSRVFLFVNFEIAKDMSDSISRIESGLYCWSTEGATAWTWCCKDKVSLFVNSSNLWFRNALAWFQHYK